MEEAGISGEKEGKEGIVFIIRYYMKSGGNLVYIILCHIIFNLSPIKAIILCHINHV